MYEAGFSCPVKFKANRDAIIFRSSDLDLHFVAYNAELLEMLTPQLDQQLAQHIGRTRLLSPNLGIVYQKRQPAPLFAVFNRK